MPSRLIRDEILDSERVQTLPVEARWLFVAIMLTADDVGLFEAATFKLGRRAGLDQNKIPVLLQLLADSDLVRLYEVAGKRFGFIPRFSQRLQIKRTKHPLPPEQLMKDDSDAVSKINHLATNPRLDNGATPKVTATQPPEPEVEPEEEKDIDPTGLVVKASPYRRPDCPIVEIVSKYHEALPALPVVEVLSEGRKKAIAARWRDVVSEGKLDRKGGLEWFDWYFARVAGSPFLTGKQPGRSGKPFRADIEFLMTASKFTRVVEGFYHGAKA